GRGFTTIRPNLPATLTDERWRDRHVVLQDHLGEWWVPTREGLYRFGKVDFEQLARARPAAVYRTRDGLANDDVTGLFEDSHGDIWAASWIPSREPVAHWERATARFHAYGENEGLRPFTTATAFGEDKTGTVWIGFREGGVA